MHKKITSLKLGIKEFDYEKETFFMNKILEANNTKGFNDFIIVYNIQCFEAAQVEKNKFLIKDENLVYGKKELIKKPVSEINKESILDYIIENKSFPYYIQNKKYQKIKLNASKSNENYPKYIKL